MKPNELSLTVFPFPEYGVTKVDHSHERLNHTSTEEKRSTESHIAFY